MRYVLLSLLLGLWLYVMISAGCAGSACDNSLLNQPDDSIEINTPG